MILHGNLDGVCASCGWHGRPAVPNVIVFHEKLVHLL
jgi:hypothetical protein